MEILPEQDPRYLNTKWRSGDIVRIKQFGPHRDAYAQVIRVEIPRVGQVAYAVRIFYSDKRLVVKSLRTNELERGDVDPLTFLALQALPDEPEQGKEIT